MKLQVLESTHHQLGKKHIVPINDTRNPLGYTLSKVIGKPF